MSWSTLLNACHRFLGNRSRKGRFDRSAVWPNHRVLSVEALEERVLLTNFINLPITRVDDALFPSTAFLANIDVNIPDESGVTGVSVTLGGGTVSVLEHIGGGEWFGEEPFTSLAAAKTGVNGTWTVEITGTTPSTSTFTLDVTSAVDGDFFATPTLTNPTHGASAVPSNTIFTWTDPTGASTPDAIQVVSEDDNETLLQLDNNLTGTMNVTDTSWTPPMPLAPGPNEFDVFYLEVVNGFLGDLMVTSGSITWSDSPFDPDAGVNPTPLLSFGSQTIIGFDVAAAGGNDTAGLFDPVTGKFFLKNSNSAGVADSLFRFGPAGAGWTPVTGDWDGNPTVTVGLFDPARGKFFLKNSNSAGVADLVFRFGPAAAGWTPVTGDWDGNGTDTVGLFDPVTGKFFLKNSNSAGAADLVFRYGPAGIGWTPITGDWDGNGTDSIGLFDPVSGKFFLKNSNSAGVADSLFRFGPAGAGWTPVTGDWDGNPTVTVGLFDPVSGKFFLKNSNSAGAADLVFRYGPAGIGWTPITGDWDSATSLGLGIESLVPEIGATNVEIIVNPYAWSSFYGETGAVESELSAAAPVPIELIIAPLPTSQPSLGLTHSLANSSDFGVVDAAVALDTPEASQDLPDDALLELLGEGLLTTKEDLEVH